MNALITATAIAAILYTVAAFIQYAIASIQSRKAPAQRHAFTVICPSVAIQKSGVANHLTIRQAKAVVKEMGLAEQCRAMTGKSWSRCNRGELIAAIASL